MPCTIRWVFFPPEDTPLLYPVYTHSTDTTFQPNLSSPNLTLHPLLAFTHPHECVLQSGEVLYVPSGCAHRVENLEKYLAISANFVDCSNFEWVKRELSANTGMSGFKNVLPSESGNCDQSVNIYKQVDDSKSGTLRKLKPKSRINTEDLE